MDGDAVLWIEGGEVFGFQGSFSGVFFGGEGDVDNGLFGFPDIKHLGLAHIAATVDVHFQGDRVADDVASVGAKGEEGDIKAGGEEGWVFILSA